MSHGSRATAPISTRHPGTHDNYSNLFNACLDSWHLLLPSTHQVYTEIDQVKSFSVRHVPRLKIQYFMYESMNCPLTIITLPKILPLVAIDKTMFIPSCQRSQKFRLTYIQPVPYWAGKFAPTATHKSGSSSIKSICPNPLCHYDTSRSIRDNFAEQSHFAGMISKGLKWFLLSFNA